eukprot:12252934-Alexandrium_andersonii.AAC.1
MPDPFDHLDVWRECATSHASAWRRLIRDAVEADRITNRVRHGYDTVPEQDGRDEEGDVVMGCGGEGQAGEHPED